jgi:hypothetical protein
MSPEILTPEIVETPKQAVESFIKFNRQIYLDHPSALEVVYTESVDKIFGNEELEVISRNQEYKGIEGTRNKLKEAFIKEGGDGLRKEFALQIKDNISKETYRKIRPFLKKVSKI